MTGSSHDLIEANLVDCMVALHGQLFYGSGHQFLIANILKASGLTQNGFGRARP